MDANRKRQRGMAFPRIHDGGIVEDSRYEHTIKQEDLRQEYALSPHHSPLFLSRHASEEPRKSCKVPSFLDHDDEEAFLQMGFHSAAPLNLSPSTTQTVATSSVQQPNRTLPGNSSHVTTVKREPAVQISTIQSSNEAMRPVSTPKQRSTPPSSARQQHHTAVRDNSHVTTVKSEPAVQTPTASPPSQAIHPSSFPKQLPTSTSSSSTRVIKAPREPNEALKRYTTSHYARYDPNRNNNTGPLAGKFTGTFRIYDAYTLVTDPTLQIRHLPTSGVRVDDFLAGKLLMSHYGAKILHEAWPAEFDHNGMIRATRIPLGHAAKLWRSVGERDVDGKVIEWGQEGWYYDWWSGLHCLMGKEGYDKGLYLVRPSWEKFLCEGMAFKVGYKAVVQFAAGDENDPTPGL